jgi:hypothetical protein
MAATEQLGGSSKDVATIADRQLTPEENCDTVN